MSGRKPQTRLSARCVCKMRTPSASRASGSPSGTRRRRPNPRSRPPRAPVLTDCRLDSSHESISSVVSPASCLDPPFHTDAILSTGTPRSGERVEHSHQSTTCLFVMTKRRLSGALASARSGTAPSRLSGTPFQPRRYAFHLTPPPCDLSKHGGDSKTPSLRSAHTNTPHGRHPNVPRAPCLDSTARAGAGDPADLRVDGIR